ncbi:2577_t:CDS:2 [Acaulospora morrowiae]|uniref:2577_t:CDS:1 n=1 Tax=Acaulospora morrowiae TaxID=94023 RepID=A0A9N9A8N6_9GLOM|nr:2577_t:CDS:2 [Acaulospora morrowiae]
MKFNTFLALIIFAIFCLVANVYEVNASTIKLKSTFSQSSNGRADIYECDSSNEPWSDSHLYFYSNQSECLMFSTSVSLSTYCFHLRVDKADQWIDNVDNSQDTCYELDGSEYTWTLSSIDCGQIPSDIVNCDK